MFERFTERARQVVVLAQEEARALKHDHIGSEHILLGLLREEEGLAARALEGSGVTVERVRAQVVRLVEEQEQEISRPRQVPFTPTAKKILEVALRESLSLGHNYIGTEHILLSLIRVPDGVDSPEGPEAEAGPDNRRDVAREILDIWEVTSDQLRNEVIRLLSGPGARRRPAPQLQPSSAGEVRVEIHDLTGAGFRPNYRRVFARCPWARLPVTEEMVTVGGNALVVTSVIFHVDGWVDLRLGAEESDQGPVWSEGVLASGFTQVDA